MADVVISPASSGEERAEKYRLKTTTADAIVGIAANIVEQRPDMLTRMTEKTEDWYQLELTTKGLLASEDAVVSRLIPFYLSFAREVWSCKLRMSGGAQLNNDVALRLAKWKGRGLIEAVLIRIRNEVFSVPAPGAPGGVLRLDTVPNGATVVVSALSVDAELDSQTTPCVLELPVGENEISISKPLFVAVSFVFTVVDGGDDTLLVNLLGA